MSAQFSPELIELSERMIAADADFRAASQLDANNPMSRAVFELALREAAAARRAFQDQLDRDIAEKKKVS